jgi:hypothetical protein
MSLSKLYPFITIGIVTGYLIVSLWEPFVKRPYLESQYFSRIKKIIENDDVEELKKLEKELLDFLKIENDCDNKIINSKEIKILVNKNGISNLLEISEFLNNNSFSKCFEIDNNINILSYLVETKRIDKNFIELLINKNNVSNEVKIKILLKNNFYDLISLDMITQHLIKVTYDLKQQAKKDISESIFNEDVFVKFFEYCDTENKKNAIKIIIFHLLFYCNQIEMFKFNINNILIMANIKSNSIKLDTICCKVINDDILQKLKLLELYGFDFVPHIWIQNIYHSYIARNKEIDDIFIECSVLLNKYGSDSDKFKMKCFLISNNLRYEQILNFV